MFAGTEPQAGMSPVLKIVAALVVLVLAAGAGWWFWGVDLVVVTVPPDAKVWVDQQPVAPQSFGRYALSHLARRSHTVTVKRDGYTDSTQTVDYAWSDNTQWVTVRLTPEAGSGK